MFKEVHPLINFCWSHAEIPILAVQGIWCWNMIRYCWAISSNSALPLDSFLNCRWVADNRACVHNQIQIIICDITEILQKRKFISNDFSINSLFQILCSFFSGPLSLNIQLEITFCLDIIFTNVVDLLVISSNICSISKLEISLGIQIE